MGGDRTRCAGTHAGVLRAVPVHQRVPVRRCHRRRDPAAEPARAALRRTGGAARRCWSSCISLFFLRDTLRFGLRAVEGDRARVQRARWSTRWTRSTATAHRCRLTTHLLLFAASVIAAAGLLIHLVAVQISQAAWAGLLLLTMYTVPAATVHGGLPALLFIPPAVGYIVLLSAEGRTRLQSLGPPHLRRLAPRRGRTDRGLGARPGRSPDRPERGRAGRAAARAAAGAAGRRDRQRSRRWRQRHRASAPSISATDPMLDMGKNLKRGDNVTALTYTGGPAGGDVPAADRAGPLRRQHLADLAAVRGPEDRRRRADARRPASTAT